MMLRRGGEERRGAKRRAERAHLRHAGVQCRYSVRKITLLLLNPPHLSLVAGVGKRWGENDGHRGVRKRRKKAPVDVNKAMAIWEAFFTNSMKRRMVSSTDDFRLGGDTGGGGVPGLLWTPRNSVAGVEDEIAAKVRNRRLQEAREQKSQKEYLWMLKVEKTLAGLRRKGKSDEEVRRAKQNLMSKDYR